MQLRALLQWAIETLKESSATARLDAEILLSFAAGLRRSELITKAGVELSSEIEERFAKLLERRARYEPVAYLTGEKEFYGLTFKVTPAVLIPRPETELLVEQGLEFLKNRVDPVRILDLCTGSGCIAIALAVELKKKQRDFEIAVADISIEALAAAKENAQLNQQGGIKFIEGDLFAGIAAGAQFDLIVSNPPYVAPGDPHTAPELRYEPNAALFAEEGGLAIIRRIVRSAPSYLKPGGRLLFEIGAGQAEAVRQIFESEKLDLESPVVLKDLAGLDRVISFDLCVHG